MLTTFSKHEKRHRHRHRRRSLAPPALSPLLVQELTVPQESLDSDTVETLEADVAPMQSFGTHPSRRPSHGGPVTVKLGAQPLGVKYPGPQGVTGLPSTAAVSRSTAVVALSTPVDQPVEESALEKQAQAADASDMIVIPKATLLALLSSKPTQTPSRPAVLSGVAVPNLTALAMSAEPGPSNFLNIPRIQLRNHLRTANVGRERRAVV